MFCSYSAVVLSIADESGQLSDPMVSTMLSEHGFTVAEWTNDCSLRGWVGSEQNSAQRLLTWLGY